MITLASIVTGDSEVVALPILVRRIAAELDPGLHVEVPRPWKVQETKLLGRPGELELHVERIARLTPNAALLVLLDCDDGCPATLGPSLQARAVAARADMAIEVALAKREFESWFLASASGLRGQRRLAADLEAPPDPESIRDAKGWLAQRRTPRGYNEVADLPAFTARFDLALARQRSDSFAATERRIVRLLEVLRRRGP